MAMGGAYVLAKALETAPEHGIEQALSQYDARLRPFVMELQEKSRRFAGQFIPNSWFGLWITDMMVSLVNFQPVKRYVGKQFNIQSLFEVEAKQG